MLDKMQLELIKGLLTMNLGEDIEEFEKPSTIIHDPVSQVICYTLNPVKRPLRAQYPMGDLFGLLLHCILKGYMLEVLLLCILLGDLLEQLLHFILC